MANPQPENGGVLVAYDLYAAIDRTRFTVLERQVVSAVMYFTYGVRKTKAVVSAQDIRYYLGSPGWLRVLRVQEVIDKLVTAKVLFRQRLVNGSCLLGLSKDYDLWALAANAILQKSINITNSSKTALAENGPVERLLEYMKQRTLFTNSNERWQRERQYAKKLYVQTLEANRSPENTFSLLCDYIAENEWMQKNVPMPFTYMSSRFEAWRAQIPPKPREIRETEEAMGKRYRYDVKLKQWRVT